MKDNKRLYFDVIISRICVGYFRRLSMITRNWNTSSKSPGQRVHAGFPGQRVHAVKLIVPNRGGIGPRNIESGFRIPETRDFGSYGMCYSSRATRDWASNSLERPNWKAALAYLRSFWYFCKRFAPIWQIRRQMLG